MGYELAGPGSRFVAFVLDALLITAFLLGSLFLGLILVGGTVASAFNFAGIVWVFAILTVVTFVIIWGYFVLFEGLRDGQTPGKRAMGLRVVHQNGFPIALGASAIRNLIRIIDLQPGLTGVVGGLFILLHPRAQRPGDLAAGTVVIRERTSETLPEEAVSRESPVLSDDEYAVLRTWALQRSALDRKARQRITGRLVRQLGDRVPQAAPEDALQELYTAESGRRAAMGGHTGSGSPAAASLLRRQRPRWQAWDRLLAQARTRGLPSLPESDVSEFAALYREVTADLARARTYGASTPLLSTLEDAVGRGHNLLYSAPQRSVRSVWNWLIRGVPRLVRSRWRPMALGAALFFGPALITFAAVAGQPDRIEQVVPAEILNRAAAAEEQRAQGIGYGEAVISEGEMPIAAASILTNNVRVTFLAFAGGIILGAGTLLVLVLNGVMLGGAAAAFHAQGQSMHLWSFVMPHGVLELSAICLAGGAGLWMGSAVLLPGRRTRSDALVERSRDAISVLGGVVVLLVIAGIIEGFVSPSPLISEWGKVAFGIFTGVLLFPWLLLAGRSDDGEE